MDRKFPITISIDNATLQRLDELAAAAKKSRSEIVRLLIDNTAKKSEATAL